MCAADMKSTGVRESPIAKRLKPMGDPFHFGFLFPIWISIYFQGF